MKGLLRNMVSHLVARSGVVAAGRSWFPRYGVFILYGHRVAEDNEGYLEGLRPAWFDEQVSYLTRHYEVIALTDLLSCFERHRPLPERAAVLTFDDGFRDNLEAALPILRKHHVTATVFLVTGSLETGALPWSQRLGALFQRTGAGELSHPLVGEKPLKLGSRRNRHHAYTIVKEPMKQMARERREDVLSEMSLRLGVSPPEGRMLTWDGARELQANGWSLGAHTWSHPWLAEINAAEARWEIERSAQDLRDQLGIDHAPFCFPAGSLNLGLVNLVKSYGFRCAFRPSSYRGPNTLANADPFSLVRIGLPNGPGVQLAAELDGPLNAVRSTLRSLRFTRGK